MMVISRTPMRVSLFGGGTDYRNYFENHRGAVLGMAIDKYIYIAALRLSGIQTYNFRLAYSRIELVDRIEDIQHRAVRAALQHYPVPFSLDISTMADMPASSGLGSSSTFSVGLLNLLAYMRKDRVTKLDLALRANHLEYELLGENVGVQDPLHASFGGVNRFDFDGKQYRVTPMFMRSESLDALIESLVLVHTGVTRHASSVVEEQVQKTKAGELDRQLGRMLDMVDEATDILFAGNPAVMLSELGRMLHDSWMLKRSLSSGISSSGIDELYELAMSCGALGGKLCGAGGGGFLLMVVPPEQRGAFIEKIAPARAMSIGLDTQGSTIIYSAS